MIANEGFPAVNTNSMKPLRRILTPGLLETAACAAIAFFISWRTQNLTYIAIWSLVGWTQMLRTRRATTLGLWLFSPVFDLLLARPLKAMEAFGVIRRRHLARRDVSKRTGYFSRDRDGEEQLVPAQYSPSPEHSEVVRFTEITDFLKQFLPERLPNQPFALAIISFRVAFGGFVALVLTAAAIMISASLIRIATIIVTTVTHPLEGLRAIPPNWRRIGWSLEMLAPLEFVPRHRLFLRLRKRSSIRPTSETEELLGGLAITHFTSGGRGMLLRTMICLLGAVFLIWLPWSIHNPAPPLDLSEIAEGELLEPQLLLFFTETLREKESGPSAKSLENSVVPNVHLDEFSERLIEQRNYTRFHAMSEAERAGVVKQFLRSPEGQQYVERLKQRRLKYFDLFDPFDWIDGVVVHRGLFPAAITIVCALFAFAVYFALWTIVLLFAWATPLRAILFLPTLAYRFSLKASALTYAPLFFVIEGPFDPYKEPKKVFEQIQQDAWPAVQRAVAKFLAFILVLKILAATAWPSLVAQLPPGLKVWAAGWKLPLDLTHLASAIVLLSTFAVWYLTRRALWRVKEKSLTSLTRIARVVRTLERLRSTVAIFTVSCFVYWAATRLVPILPKLVLPDFRWGL